MNDHHFMARALQLAEQGVYTTHPNPRVGCVLVKNGVIIGEGFTQPAGQAHAEVQALQNASESVENATAYVTLEPCSHTGKTPPCADALIAAGIKRAVIATLDPNPKVAGRGVKKLVEANIEVKLGVQEVQARALNAGFMKRMEHGRPFVRVKLAMSLDGKTALQSGESQWITGPKARQDVQYLRAQADAILTGSGTVLADNPSLNVRLSAAELGIETPVRQPLRVVLDTKLKTPIDAKLLKLVGDTLIYTCADAADKISNLQKAGAIIHPFSAPRIELSAVLDDLANREINEVHVEAGATLCGALIAEQLVDELIIYMAPTLLGGDARSLLALPQLQSMQDKINLNIQDIRAIGADWRITASPIRREQSDK